MEAASGSGASLSGLGPWARVGVLWESLRGDAERGGAPRRAGSGAVPGSLRLVPPPDLTLGTVRAAPFHWGASGGSTSALCPQPLILHPSAVPWLEESAVRTARTLLRPWRWPSQTRRPSSPLGQIPILRWVCVCPRRASVPRWGTVWAGCLFPAGLSQCPCPVKIWRLPGCRRRAYLLASGRPWRRPCLPPTVPPADLTVSELATWALPVPGMRALQLLTQRPHLCTCLHCLSL